MTKHNLTIEKRIELNTVRLDNGCLAWKSCMKKRRYPTMTINGMTRKVSRLVMNATNSVKVLHTCDYPPCVEKAHLFFGSMKDNTQDMIKKGRSKLTRVTKLDASKVRAIRASKASHQQLAKQHGVTRPTITRAKNGTLWKSVNT